ncbi:MAG: hypothetical protein L0J67_10845 [Halomonas sp.]|nr:hypothetical protein [Halomonas sp.]MDN6337116.1 hypothetical protein [Halomonas sp.]
MYKLPMRSRSRRFLWVLISAGLLSGCGSSEEDVPAPAASETTESRGEPTTPAPAVKPLVVSISAEASMRDDRRLNITGRTNLPDDAQLLVVVERETSGARWHERTRVQGGQFQAGPMGYGSGVPDGDYRVRVQLSEASIQPSVVRERIGAKGEGLEGELVRKAPHGLGYIAVYTREFSVGSRLRRMQEEGDKVHYPQG